MDFTITFETNSMDNVVDVRGSCGWSTAEAIIAMYNEFARECRANCIMADPDECYCEDEFDPESIQNVTSLRGITKTAITVNVYDKKFIYGVAAFKNKGHVTVVCPSGWLNSLVDILVEKDFDYETLTATCVVPSSELLNAWFNAGAPLFWGPNPNELQRVE